MTWAIVAAPFLVFFSVGVFAALRDYLELGLGLKRLPAALIAAVVAAFVTFLVVHVTTGVMPECAGFTPEPGGNC